MIKIHPIVAVENPRLRLWKGNRIGWYVDINGKRTFFGCLTKEEAIQKAIEKANQIYQRGE